MIKDVMKSNLQSMSADELWGLYEDVARMLAERLIAEKELLETRLAQLNQRQHLEQKRREKSARRPYPRVFPKFRNPDQPSQTWAGRGKRPRWLVAQLKSGKRIEEFRIDRSA